MIVPGHTASDSTGTHYKCVVLELRLGTPLKVGIHYSSFIFVKLSGSLQFPAFIMQYFRQSRCCVWRTNSTPLSVMEPWIPPMDTSHGYLPWIPPMDTSHGYLPLAEVVIPQQQRLPQKFKVALLGVWQTSHTL